MLLGKTQRKPMGLFGGFAPGMQQMPQADPMGMQQPLGQEAAASMQGVLQQQRKPGVDWLGVVADTLAGAAGREGPYAASMRARQEQEAAQENARQQREASMQDWRTKFDYERANPAPKDPYRFEDNAGNVWQMGSDGQPQRIFTDQAPKQYMTNGGMVNVPNPYANGAGAGPAAPPTFTNDDWNNAGGVSGNAGPRFPVNANSLDRITVQAESGGNPNAVSPKGARGRWQVMPATARDPGFGIKASNGSQADDERVGAEYRRKMEARYGGDPAKMWAAYNWGPGNLDNALEKHGNNWLQYAPAETRNYVNRNMRALRGGK